MTTKKLEQLIARAKRTEMSPDQRERQRRSFAYGNAHIEDSRVTKEVVRQAAEKMESR